jgi:hypothetical protein
MVLLAQSPGRATSAPHDRDRRRNWIVFADGHGIAARLARAAPRIGATPAHS